VEQAGRPRAAVRRAGCCLRRCCLQVHADNPATCTQNGSGRLECQGCFVKVAPAAPRMLRLKTGRPHTDSATLQCSTAANSAPQPEAAVLQSRVNAMTAERELLTAQLAQV
jgi:hypothetical protein